MRSLLLILFSVFFFVVKSSETPIEDVRILTCPIKSETDLFTLRQLEEEGRPIDIFDEIIQMPHSDSDSDSISASSPTSSSSSVYVTLLTDEMTAQFLLSRQGCFEQKSAGSLNKIFQPNLSLESRTNRLGELFHSEYRSYDNINDQLNYYKEIYPDLVKQISSVGKSHEGRNLNVIHITAAPIGTKPLIWIMAGQHAREWIAPAATFYFIELLLSDQKNSELLQNYEFAILPLVNPDGYEFTRTTNRMWRKNRRAPHGVDLNRNWDHRWCEIGSSRNPRTDVYCGPGPASEPETSQVQNYILSLPNRVLGFDVHSYGQVVLRNYGWTRNPSPLESATCPMTRSMTQAMNAADGQFYKAMLSSGLYPTSGGADDWLYVKAGIPGSVIELRDNGQNGFKLPKEQIKPTGLELYNGIITAISHVKSIAAIHQFPNHQMILTALNMTATTTNNDE